MVKKDIVIIPKKEYNYTLNDVERDVIYSEIQNKYNIDRQHIENFKKGEDILKNRENRLNISDIDSISLKNILKYTYPIISDYPDSPILKSNIHIEVVLDYELYGIVFKKNKTTLIKIPKYSKINVIGIIFPFFSYEYYPIFNWYISDNSTLYFYSDTYKCDDDIIKNNIQIFKKIFYEDIHNKGFTYEPENLINLNSSDELLNKYGFLFNKNHTSLLLHNIIDFIDYYLKFYDNNKIGLIHYTLSNNSIYNTIDNIFYLTDYYNTLPIYYTNNDIDNYNKVLDYTNTISNNYTINILYTFNDLGLILLYDYIYLYGFDSIIVKKYIESIKQKNNIIEQKKQNNNKYVSNKLINIKYERIAEKKFPNLFNSDHKDNLFNKNNTFDIYKLPSKYRDIILIEYRKQEDFNKGFINNKCPHLKIYNQYRYSVDIDKKYYNFNLLKEFINVSNNTEYYKCNNCGFNIICPHEYEVQLELENIQIEKMTDNLNKTYNISQKIVNKYMSNAPIDFIYFCKICSEKIGESFYLEQPTEFKDNIRLNSADDFDELKKDIISNTYYIIYTYVNFNLLLINKNKLIFNIVDIIRPILGDIDINLNKNKSLDNVKRDNLLKFNVIIYVFASLIQLISVNKELSFKDTTTGRKKYVVPFNRDEDRKLIIKKGGLTQPNEKNIKILLQQAFDIILSSQNILINNLSLSSENIKQTLISAYSNIIKKSTAEFIDISDLHSNIKKLIINNPIYSYVYSIKQIYPLVNGYNNNTKEYKFEDIINKSRDCFDISKINKYQKENVKVMDNFDSIIDNKNTKFDVIYNNIFDKIDLPTFSKNNGDLLYKDNSITSISAYKYLSYKNFRYYIINSIYKYSPSIEQHSNYSEYDLNIINLYNDENKYLLDYDKKLDIDRKKQYLKPLTYLHTSTARLFKFNINNLNRYFCVSGIEQDFNILIFRNIKTNKIEKVEHNKLDNFIHNNDAYFNNNLQLIDRYNERCDIYLSNIEKQSQDTISKNSKLITNNIKKLSLIQSFYNYYNIKCPVKETHNFINNICKKCGISQSDIKNKSEKFFNKFKDKFIKHLENKNKSTIDKLNEWSDNYKYYSNNDYVNDLTNKFDTKNMDKFIVNTNYKLLLSKKFNINEKYLEFIGIAEGKEYDLLPKMDIEDDDIFIEDRILKLKNILRLIIIYYNKLKFSENISKFDNPDFEDIILNFTRKNNSLNKLNKLKQIPLDYYEVINIKEIELDNKGISELIQNIIWNFIYFILEQANNDLYDIIFNFTKFILERITEFDEIYSNYSLIKLKRDREDYKQNTLTVNIDYDYYDDDDEEIDGDIINYDAFDLDLVDNDLDDIDSFD